MPQANNIFISLGDCLCYACRDEQTVEKQKSEISTLKGQCLLEN